jgi:hypothetical protein
MGKVSNLSLALEFLLGEQGLHLKVYRDKLHSREPNSRIEPTKERQGTWQDISFWFLEERGKREI